MSIDPKFLETYLETIRNSKLCEKLIEIKVNLKNLHFRYFEFN